MLVESTNVDREAASGAMLSIDVESTTIEDLMRRRLITGALSLACLVGLSVPLVGAGGVSAKTTTETCKTIRYDETKLVWNATHTKRIEEIVYKVVPERAMLDGYKPFVNVAVAVVVTKQVCSK